jgi:hypothetical protein
MVDSCSDAKTNKPTKDRSQAPAAVIYYYNISVDRVSRCRTNIHYYNYTHTHAHVYTRILLFLTSACVQQPLVSHSDTRTHR